MTLILSHLSRAFAIQVTDRLVTRVARNPQPFDVLANKNVVFIARDAVVSIAYTGPAYIGHLPTDDWIAQELSGIDVSEQFGMRSGPLPRFLDIGQAMRLLARELARSEVALQKANFELIAIGWQWKNTRRKLEGRYEPVPMAWEISKPANKAFEVVERLPRNWHQKHRNYFCALPRSNFSSDEKVRLFKDFDIGVGAGEASTEATVDQLERASVNSIRSVSSANRYVGPNCMSIVLAPPHQQAFIGIKFVPYDSHSARFVTQNFVSPDFPATYSPWLIGGGFMHRPSVFVGNRWRFQVGPFTVAMLGPSISGSFGATSSQPRPLRPTR